MTTKNKPKNKKLCLEFDRKLSLDMELDDAVICAGIFALVFHGGKDHRRSARISNALFSEFGFDESGGFRKKLADIAGKEESLIRALSKAKSGRYGIISKGLGMLAEDRVITKMVESCHLPSASGGERNAIRKYLIDRIPGMGYKSATFFVLLLLPDSKMVPIDSRLARFLEVSNSVVKIKPGAEIPKSGDRFDNPVRFPGKKTSPREIERFEQWACGKARLAFGWQNDYLEMACKIQTID